MRDVRAALYDALSLRRRQLGQPVFLGDIYAVVENVPGVSTSRCVLNDDPTANRDPVALRRGPVPRPGKPADAGPCL